MVLSEVQQIEQRLANAPRAGWPDVSAWTAVLEAELRNAGVELDVDAFFDVAAMAAFLANAPTDIERLLNELSERESERAA